MRQRRIIPGVDPKLLIKDATKLMPDASRRGFLRGAASLGALTFLTGCDIIDGETAEVLCARFRNSTMAFRPRCSALRSSHRLIPKAQLRNLSPSTPTTTRMRRRKWTAKPTSWKSPVSSKTRSHGRSTNCTPCLMLADYPSHLRRGLERDRLLARHAAGGIPQTHRADTRAKYIWFKCAEGYTNTIDMPTALHPQTQMTFKFANRILPRAYGYPMKIRMPTKLGFKNPKYVVAMEVTNIDKGGYWEDKGYNWFSGL